MIRAREISNRRRSPPERTAGLLLPSFSQAGVLFEHLFSGLTCLVRPVHKKTAHEHVFLNRHVRKDRVVLENVGNTGFFEFFVGTQAGNVAAPHFDAPTHDVGKSVDGVQHRRLSGAIGPYDAKRLLRTYLQIKFMQYLHLAVAGPQGFNGKQRLLAHQ
jgi:hypothetical protein